MSLLLSGSRRFGVYTQQGEEFEPVDKPVRFYETLLCFTAQLLIFGALETHYRAAELAATASVALLLAVSLWKLLVPPRLSVTRCAFVCIGLICVVLLFVP